MAQSATEFQQSGAPAPIGVGGETPEGVPVVARSPRQIFWARFRQDKLAIAGGIMVILMILLALGAGLSETISGHGPAQQFKETGGILGETLMLNDFGSPLGPNSNFWFGADDLGRDLFVRVLYGARTSLKIAIIATGIELAIGVFLGMLAGFRRGWVDTIVSRLVDLVLSIPLLLLGISLGVATGGGETMVIFLIAFFGWPYIARIVRGQTLSLRESQFIEAAHSLGASSRWIMFREILPNLVAPIIVYATLIIPTNIVAESALSFLGVGVQEPTASWGKMLDSATRYVSFGAAWWYMVFPGAALFVTVLGFNLLGDGLRDALDPKTKG
ncbi:MAG TPA: ABC transporter permease [Actinomycetota bacterium]|nr:ABC transporter permease [Actinomycetota bacterium]